jgi:uncharacterized membrane protein
MTDTIEATAAPRAHEDRIVPAVVYILYIVGLTHGLTIFIGLLVAYFNKADASPRAQSHYVFLIRTFWLSIGWFMIGIAACVVGAIGSIVLVGIPVLLAGIAIVSSVWLWFLARCLVGGYYLLKDEPYPRPQSWLF